MWRILKPAFAIATTFAFATNALANADAGAPPKKMTLADCLRVGVEKSFQLADAEWQHRAALARRSEARWSRWFPYMEIGFIFAPMPEMRGNPLDGTPICDKVAGVCSANPTDVGFDRVTGGYGTYKKFDFNLVMPLDVALKLTAVDKIASRAADAVAHQRERTRRRVIYDVTRAFWAVKTARAVDDLLEDGMDKVRSGRKTILERLAKKEKGYTKTDLYKFDAFSADAEGKYAEAKKFTALGLSTLKLAMGLSETDLLDVDDDELEATKATLLSEETVREMAVTRRHDLRALKSAVEAKRAHVSLQKRQLAPDLYIAFNFSGQHSNVADAPANVWVNGIANTVGFAVFAGLKWTLDIPQKLARIRQAEAELKSLTTQFELATRAIAFEAKQAYHELAEQRTKLAVNQKAKKSMRQWLISSMLNFETGLIETRDLIDALGAYFKAMAALYRAIHDHNVGVANLAFVTEGEE
ncbi:MAG: TolC family protein [Deltaproteobacteria bacterium]|nr:TolC family protein [Deltaproteobacteria bacterium]